MRRFCEKMRNIPLRSRGKSRESGKESKSENARRISAQFSRLLLCKSALLWRCVYVLQFRLELEVDRIHVESLLSLFKERVVLKQEEKKLKVRSVFPEIFICVCQCGVAVGGSRSIIFSIKSWNDTRLKISPSRPPQDVSVKCERRAWILFKCPTLQ